MKKTKNSKFSLLIDIYKGFLTARQYEFINLYYNFDLGLSEIAAEYNVTRQTVRDSILHGEEILAGAEDKLKLLEKFRLIKDLVKKCIPLVGDGQNSVELKDSLQKISAAAEA
jgi:predicted DNA-binding protein YlxM (UPF0122 family)